MTAVKKNSGVSTYF